MIDLHCHIIPWVDDGADNAEAACLMAEHALRNGVKTIVATPHSNLHGACRNFYGPSYEKRFALFRALLRQHKIDLEVLPGAEVFIDSMDTVRYIDSHELVTLNHSRYLLVEFEFSSSGSFISSALESIAKRGLIPVVAHPERYAAVQRKPMLAARWFEKGYILQLNKGSILGRLGSGAERASLELLRCGIAHVIASDAHDTYYRPTGFHSLLPLLNQLCSPEYSRLLLQTNPCRIIQDEVIPPPHSEQHEAYL